MSILGTISPSPWFYGWYDDGRPLSGGLLWTYAAGTTTPLATYENAALTVAHTNPVVLNSAGYTVLFLAATTYKFTLTAADGTESKTVDGIASTGLSQSIVGIGATAYVFGGSEFSPITNTSYGSGITIDVCLANSGFLTIDSALLVGTFGIQAMVESVSGITTTVAIMNLSDGAPNTPIQSVTGTSTTGSLVTSLAIPFATAGVAKTYAIKPKVSAGTGFSWNVGLVRLT